MEKKLIKFHEFACYSQSKNLLIYFYINIKGDYRKAKASLKLRCQNNAERPIMNDVLMAFSTKVVTITASIGKNYGSILKYSDGTPEFFGYTKKDFYLVKRIEQLMPNCISSKHQLLVDHFVQTGDSEVVRDKRLVLIKKNRDLLYPSYLFLCFNFQYLDDFVFTAFFCEPETKDYDKKKETLLVFDQKMKLSGYSENLPQKLGIRKINQKDSQRIEMQDVFPQIDIDEVLENEVIEYQNAQFQFPLFNNITNSSLGGSRALTNKSSGYSNHMTDRSINSVKSYKTIKSMNSTQFKLQEWCLYLCDLKLVTFFRQFRSGETLQYYVCTVKEMREESVNTDEDSTNKSDFSDIEEMKDGKILRESALSIKSNDSSKQNEILQDLIGQSQQGIIESQTSFKDQKRQIIPQNLDNKRKSLLVGQQKRNKLSQITKEIENNQDKNDQNSENCIKLSEKNQSDYKLLNSFQKEDGNSLPQTTNIQQVGTKISKDTSSQTKIRQQFSTQLSNNILQNQISIQSDKDKQIDQKEKLLEIIDNPNVQRQVSNIERQQSKQDKKKDKNIKETADAQQKFRTVSKKESIILQDRKILLDKQQINLKKPEDRKKQNYSKKKLKKTDEDEVDKNGNYLNLEVQNTFRNQSSLVQENIIQPILSTQQKNEQSFCSISKPLLQNDLLIQQDKSPLISNRSAITTIESEVRINTEQLNQTHEKRKIDTDNNNDSNVPIEFKVIPCNEMSEIKEDLNEDQVKDFSFFEDRMVNHAPEESAKEKEKESTFNSKKKLRQSVLKITKSMKSKNLIKNNKLEDQTGDSTLINEQQRNNLIKQILNMLGNNKGERDSVSKEQLLEMDPKQLFQKYNQIYYNNYAKSKKGKNDLSCVQSDQSKSHEIVFKQGEVKSNKYAKSYLLMNNLNNQDDKYDYRKYEENMSLIDKYTSTTITNKKLSFVKLLKLVELMLIIIGMSISNTENTLSYDNFYHQINLIKSQSAFKNSLSQFTTLTILQDSNLFAKSELEHISLEYLTQIQTFMSIGDIVDLYENSNITYITPNNPNNLEKSITFRNAFFLNAYYLQNTVERTEYFQEVYKQYNENIVSLVQNKLNSLSESLNQIQINSILIFSCIVISLFSIFSLSIFIFYRYQKDQRWLQKLICNVPLKQIDIEKHHLDRQRKKIEMENQNALKHFQLKSFEDEIEQRMEEFKQEKNFIRKLSQSTGFTGVFQQKKLHKINNYILIKNKRHIEVNIFICTLVICLLCYSLPNIYVFFTNLTFSKSLPNSIIYFQYISQMQDSINRLNTLNVLFQQDYSNNYNKYSTLYSFALSDISQYEATLFKSKTLDKTLFSDSEKSILRDLVVNTSICDSISESLIKFDTFLGKLKYRCSLVFEGILLQGTKLTLSFLYNRYSIFQYQTSNYLAQDTTNELTFYLYVHLQYCLNKIEGYYNNWFDQNKSQNLIYLIIIISLITIIYIIILNVFFDRLKQHQQVTRQLIYLVPFTTIQLEDSIIKQVKKYSMNTNIYS